MSDAKPKVQTSGVVPYLTVDGATKAAEFYGRAFGASVAESIPPDDTGRTMHMHLHVNGCSVMLSDAFPDHGHPWKEPQGFNITLIVDDIQSWWTRAIEAGATPLMEPQLMFWGDHYGQLRDPFGVVWAMNQPA